MATTMKSVRLFAGAAIALVVGAGAACAGSIPYPDPGTPNPVIYTFTATSTGDITAYFAGSGASYDEAVGMLVNGVSTGIVGLDDQSSTIGQSLNLGMVQEGDTITFVDYVYTTGNTWYSDPSLNSDGGNHVYSTSATAGQVYSGSLAGTYVGFEDVAFDAGSDYNYFDDTFIFTNTSVTGTVPEPETWVLLVGGLGLAGFALRRRTGALPA